MADILTYLGSWSALQWVLLVLAAGFIGQFGKMMAEAVIARIRRHRAGHDAEAQQPALQEKSSAPSFGVSPPEPEPPAAGGDVPDKKALKIAAKARKKEAKKRE